MKIEWIEEYLKEAEGMIYDNRVNEGLDVMTKLLYDEPGYGFLHNHLGWAYLYYTEDLAKAELHLKMAIKFGDDYPAPYLHMGNLLIRGGRYEEAAKYLKEGLAKPNAYRVGFLEAMGQAYELKGDYANAIKAYKEATLASVVTYELTNLLENIKRCKKKKWSMLFGFL
jgi:tetratricopeptide (TPR) repeat protein